MGLGGRSAPWGASPLAAMLLTVFTVVELRTEKPLLDVRVFRIPRFTAGALSIAVAFFCLFGFIFLITQYFQFVKGYSTLSSGVHTLPFAIVAAIFTPIGAVAALKIGARFVVGRRAALHGARAWSWPASPRHRTPRSSGPSSCPWSCWRWAYRSSLPPPPKR